MKKWTLLFVSVLFLLSSCVNELENYYKTPEWLKGNSWEVLEAKGNFKLFLSAVEKTSYKDLVQGKGIITVMAPTDSAFGVYLKANNYSSVDEIPKSKLDKLIGFHLLFYSFDKEMFMNYKPNGVESDNVLPGVYYKFRTKSRDSISTEKDVTGKSYKLVHFDRFVPVLSDNFFKSYGMDAKTNYEYFYPHSTWTGTGGFNVSNASVKDYAIVSDNGYVYTVDKVLDPLESIYTNLKGNPNYSTFFNAYERFAAYTYDATATTDYGKGDSLFVKSYSDVLPSIASEWPVSSYLSLSVLSYGAHNVFAPDNASMEAFYNKYWKACYSDISKVNFLPLLVLLANHVYSSTLIFPSQIESGLMKSSFGNTIQFNRDDAQMRSLCVNGSIYGLNKVIVPPMFQKVTAPMFCDSAYSYILDMMINGGYMSTLISNNARFKVFYPSNNTIMKYSNLDGKMMSFENTNPDKYGYQIIKIESDNSAPVAMSSAQKKKFAGAHIATECISTHGTDEAVYSTMVPFNYLYTKGNKVYSSYLYNLGVDAKVPVFEKITGDWDNGDTYKLTGDGECALIPEFGQFKALTSTTTPSDLKTFMAYLTAAGFIASTPPYSFLLGERFILLVPPATDLSNFYKTLTGTTTEKQTKLAEYLKSCFINVNTSGLLDYPFPGAKVQGTLTSFGKKSNGALSTFTLTDNGTGLTVTDAQGKVANITTYFPRIYADGAVYMIDKLLSVE